MKATRGTDAAVWGAQDLTVRYGRRAALDAVSVEVRPGAVTCVVGGDGAGKSTLLRAVAGVVRPQSGRVSRPPLREIGFISGASGLYADLTVDENVAFVGAAYGLGGAERERRADALLRRTGVEGVGDRLAGRLSGGMRQKLAFALAMLHEPSLLILDEPTTGVDPVSRSEVWRLIAAAAAGGAAVLVATTYLDEAERAEQVLVLDEGRAVAAGPPEAVAAALPRPAPGTGGDRGATQGPTVASSTRAAGGATMGSRAPGGAAKGSQAAGVATGSQATGEATSSQAAGEAAMGSQAAGALVPLAQTRAATRRFGDFVAVDAVDLTVSAGEVVGLLGANGAGKTTLIRLLLGLLRPTSGAALLFGAPPSRAARRRLGYVPQGLGLWDDLSVAENLAFASAAFDAAPPALDAELEAARDTLVRDLPLGLKRRLAFSAALAHTPELLVLDEPTSGVDPKARARLWDTVHEAAARGAGVLVTTHYLEEAGQCDRLVIMAAGRVVADGTEAAIVGDRQAVEIRLTGEAKGQDEAHDAGGGGRASWADAFAALDDAGLPVALHGRTLRVPAGTVAGATERPEAAAASLAKPGQTSQTKASQTEADQTLAGVRAALDARQIRADLRLVPASLEEAFIELATGTAE